MEFKLTKKEKDCISDLKKLAKKWPKTMWLFSASGQLHVMRSGDDGEIQVVGSRHGGMSQEYIIETIHGIHNDGGDW